MKVRFKVGDEEISLEIMDNGLGDFEPDAAGGVGRTLMSAFARQLRGRSEVEPGDTGGVVARLVFPTPEPMADLPLAAAV